MLDPAAVTGLNMLLVVGLRVLDSGAWLVGGVDPPRPEEVLPGNVVAAGDGRLGGISCV